MVLRIGKEGSTLTTVALALAILAGGARLAAGTTQDAGSAKNAAESTGDSATSLSDQTELAVTVYNSNIALVRDVRQVTLASGAFRLKFMDIAATVNPATVHFRSLTDPAKLTASSSPSSAMKERNAGS